jgi:NDP-sugar pyrophosphorylase family protein
MMLKKAMILAAGLGSRLRPITENIPKALVQTEGKTLLQHALEHVAKYGIRDVIINVHHFSEQIINYLTIHRHFGMNITLSDESDELLETGGGVKKARWFLDGTEPFLVRNVDILSDLDLTHMYTWHMKERPLATLAVRYRKTSRYFLFGMNMQLCGWENRATGIRRLCRSAEPFKFLAFSGIQIIEPRIFPLIMETGKFSLTELYLRLAEDHPVNGYHEEESRWKDAGKQ